MYQQKLAKSNVLDEKIISSNSKHVLQIEISIFLIDGEFALALDQDLN